MKSELRFYFDDSIDDEMAMSRIVNADLSHRVISDVLDICRRYINGKNPDEWNRTAEEEIAEIVHEDYPDLERNYS